MAEPIKQHSKAYISTNIKAAQPAWNYCGKFFFVLPISWD